MKPGVLLFLHREKDRLQVRREIRFVKTPGEQVRSLASGDPHAACKQVRLAALLNSLLAVDAQVRGLRRALRSCPQITLRPAEPFEYQSLEPSAMLAANKVEPLIAISEAPFNPGSSAVNR